MAQKPAASARFLNRAEWVFDIAEVRGRRTLYIAGQIAFDAEGKRVGAGDLEAQIRQLFANPDARLKEAGTSFQKRGQTELIHH